MNIKQAKNEIKHTVQAYLKKDAQGEYEIPVIRQRPILLIGPPGIGKTQIMEQIARECKIGLVSYTITHHTRQSAVGLPFIREEEFEGKTYSVTEYTMSEIIASVYRKRKESGLLEGILFLDEINCVSETLAPTMLQFLQCKTFGNQAIPEGWVIVAAGNPPEYNKSVREFDVVTLDRVRRMDLEADYPVWREYAKEKHLHPAILSYLALRPKNFYKVEASVEGIQFVTARGWEDLSNLMKTYQELQIPITEEVVYEFLHHEDVAEDVAAYFDLYKKYQDDYGIEDILRGKVRPDVFARLEQAAFDERLSVCHLLLDALERYWKIYAKKKRMTDAWYEFLKKYRKKIEEAENTKECYQQLLETEITDFEEEKRNGFLTKAERSWRAELLQNMKQSAPTEGVFEREAFEMAKAGFDDIRNELEVIEQEAGEALEYAFTFMEEAFEKGQEMVVFVTELTIGKESSMYLAEHTCERYISYNEALLIGTRKAELLAELERDS